MPEPEPRVTQISPMFVAGLADTARGPGAGEQADRILLRDHVVDVEIGAFQQERGITQRLRFNLVADLATRGRPGVGDDVDKVLSYDILLHAIEGALSGNRLNLLETLADGIAARVLSHAGVARVRVGIEKLDRCSGGLGIEISRVRLAAPPVVSESPLKPGRVLVLGSDLLEVPRLPDLIDWLADGQGAVLCADAVLAAPVVAQAQAQRQIDLLAMGQAAWKLAGRDPRCTVVDSRTEMDWALRDGKLAVWAPAKMVTDAGENTPPDAADLATLALWLAEQLGAPRLELVGDVVPPAPSERVSIQCRDVDSVPA